MIEHELYERTGEWYMLRWVSIFIYIFERKKLTWLIWQKYKMLYFCRTNYDILHLAKMTQYTLYVGDWFTLIMIYYFRIGNRNIYMKTIHPVLEIMLLFHRYLLFLNEYCMSTSTEGKRQNHFWITEGNMLLMIIMGFDYYFNVEIYNFYWIPNI